MAASSPSSTLIAVEAASIFDVRQYSCAGTLYAILDACDAPAVAPKVSALGIERAVSLYRGDAEELHADIAPYLVRVDDELLDWILTNLWGEPWGVLLVTTADLAAVRTHFRKWLVVDAPSGESWYFRFYDPRVLPEYCATCDASEVAEFFGPVQRYGVADPECGVRWTRRATPQETWAMGHPAVAPAPRIIVKLPPSTLPSPGPAE